MEEKDWRKNGVEFYALPMVDFVGTASRNAIDKAVNFVDEIAQRGKSVLVMISLLLFNSFSCRGFW